VNCPECGADDLEESRSGRSLVLWLLPGAVFFAVFLSVVGVLGQITGELTPFLVGLAVYAGVIVSSYGSGANEFALSGFARCTGCDWFRDGPRAAARYAYGKRYMHIVRMAIIAMVLYFAGLSIVQMVQGAWLLGTGLQFVVLLGLLPTVNTVLEIYRPE